MPSDSWLSVGELGRLTGVNPVTLRAWERRYGLLIPERTAKGHRLYDGQHVARVEAILQWLARGAAVSQVRDLLDRQTDLPVCLEGDWKDRCQRLSEAVAQLAPRVLDQQLNEAMALYPPQTLCEQLILPLLEALQRRWSSHFDASVERAFFHTWLRSKLGARVYHDNQSLEGAPILLTTQHTTAFDAHLWLCAWLLSSSGFAVQVLEQSISARQLPYAIERLTPWVLVHLLGPRVDTDTVPALERLGIPVLLGGPSLALYEDRLPALGDLSFHTFDKPQAVLRLIQQLR